MTHGIFEIFRLIANVKKKKMLPVHIDSRFLNYLEATEVLTALGLHPLMATSGWSCVAAAPLDERVHSNLLLSHSLRLWDREFPSLCGITLLLPDFLY